MRNEEFEQLMESNLDTMFSRNVNSELMYRAYRRFLNVVHLQMIGAPEIICESERRKLYQYIGGLFAMDEAERNLDDAQKRQRDILLKEWAKCHYDAARHYFREHMGETEDEFVSKSDDDGASTEEYFHHLIGKIRK